MKLFKVMQTSFENFDKSVRSYLSKTFNSLGMEYTPNQIFGVIFDGVKGALQNVMFYIEDALTEQNIYTARRKKSFYSLAKQSGYEPYYGAAASGVLDAYCYVNNVSPSESSSKLYIKDGTSILNGTTNLPYTIMLPTDEYVVDISKPLITHRFKIVQGSYATSTFIAKGSTFETFQIDCANMFDKEYTKVYVNGELWKQAANIYDMISTDKQYIVTVGFDNTFDVTFGNGVHGIRLNEGDVVDIKYLEHRGEEGNILSTDDTKFKFIQQSYNSFGNPVSADEFIQLKLTSSISGGTNADSIELVRKMIGYNSRSLVLANEDNFKMFLKRFSFVGQSTVYCESGSLSVTASCLSSKKNQLKNPSDYLDLEESDLLLSENEKELVLTALSNSGKTFLGTTFRFEDPIINSYSMICYVKAKSMYNRDSIKESIRNVIARYFMDLPENTKFIAKSDLIKLVVDSDDNIEAFDFDFISEKAETAYKEGFYNEYVLQLKNGEFKYIPVKHTYDKMNLPGLDAYGNIVISSELEIPLLHGGFYYYPNKETGDKTTAVKVESIETLFI